MPPAPVIALTQRPLVGNGEAVEECKEGRVYFKSITWSSTWRGKEKLKLMIPDAGCLKASLPPVDTAEAEEAEEPDACSL